MNILFLSLMHPESRKEEIRKNAKHGLQMQIESLQRALLAGMKAHLKANETIDIINALPVGIFPVHYQKIWLRGGQSDERMTELSSLNLPFFKQLDRKRGAIKAIEAWAKQSKDNRTIVMYTLYLPFLQAAYAVKKRFPDLQVCVVVTDLPGKWGISSGRTGWLQKMEHAMGQRALSLCEKMDRFVLLTKQMAEVLPIDGKLQMVMEGAIQEKKALLESFCDNETQPTFLYTGTLNRELGIAELLEAFQMRPEYRLWLCGTGDMDETVKETCKAYSNITYFGFVAQEKAIELQAKATALINPRTPNGLYTKYSFPSKTLEYLRAGKSVLCYHLEGIPADYDAHLHYMEEVGAKGIATALDQLLAIPFEERRKSAQEAKNYVLRTKTPYAQCEALMMLLRQPSK